MPLEKAGTDEVVQVLGQCSSWWPPQRACYFLIVLRAFGELLDDLPIDLCLSVEEVGKDALEFIEQQRRVTQS